MQVFYLFGPGSVVSIFFYKKLSYRSHIKFTFKVYNSLFFSMLTRLNNYYPLSNSRASSLPLKKCPVPISSYHSSPDPSTRQLLIYFLFVWTSQCYIIPREVGYVLSSMSGFFHWTVLCVHSSSSYASIFSFLNSLRDTIQIPHNSPI